MREGERERERRERRECFLFVRLFSSGHLYENYSGVLDEEHVHNVLRVAAVDVLRLFATLKSIC